MLFNPSILTMVTVLPAAMLLAIPLATSGLNGNAKYAGPDGKNKPAPFKQVKFVETARVPYQLEIPVGEAGPAQAWLRTQQPLVDLLSTARYERKKKDLWIHFANRPRPLKIKDGKKPVVVEFNLAGSPPNADGRLVPVVFYSKLGQWYAAPAAMAQAKTTAGVLEILDVDLDGIFGSSNDYLAWRGGGFHYCGETPLVYSNTALLGLSLTEYRGKSAVLLIDFEGGEDDASASFKPSLPSTAITEHPADLDPAIASAWLRTNELRNQIGLEPVALDLSRVDAATKHAKYLQLNAPSRTTSDINVHDEVPGAPGFTQEGRRAAEGNVKWGSNGHDLATQPDYEFSTLFHRSEFIYPSPTMGAGGDGGYGVVWVESAQADNARWLNQQKLKSRWVMIPAPGQTDVPRRAVRDSPIPASVPDFYNSPRGWPISVATSHQYGELSDVSLRVFDAKGKEVEGFAITMGDAGFGNPAFQAHHMFAAKSPLASESKYRVEFRARVQAKEVEQDNGRDIRFDWTFETGK